MDICGNRFGINEANRHQTDHRVTPDAARGKIRRLFQPDLSGKESHMNVAPESNCIVFNTDIGWTAVLWNRGVISRIRTGFSDRRSLVETLQARPGTADKRMEQMIARIRQFASGKRTDLSAIVIDESSMTPFQRKVVRACRSIAWGETLTYGQLARLAGSPGASRAVGTVMSNNRFPLVVPCHRVVSASGIGGFSAPCGIELKRKLLTNEQGPNSVWSENPALTESWRQKPRRRQPLYARMS